MVRKKIDVHQFMQNVAANKAYNDLSISIESSMKNRKEVGPMLARFKSFDIYNTKFQFETYYAMNQI